jgi:hypothetical protein
MKKHFRKEEDKFFVFAFFQKRRIKGSLSKHKNEDMCLVAQVVRNEDVKKSV